MSKKIKVLHLLKTSVGAVWALRQVNELIKLGVDVVVALPDGPLVEKYRDAGAQVIIEQFDFSPKHPLLMIKRIKRLRKVVTDISPDIIHSHFVGTTFTMRLALRSFKHIPRIFMVPGPLHLEHCFFRLIDKLLSQSNDYWIATCQWTKDSYLKHGIREEKLGLTYYGCYPENFTQNPKGKLRKLLGLRRETIIVGMVAYMYSPKRYLGQKRGIKGHEDFIDAIAICRKKIPDIVGVVIGGPFVSKDKKYEIALRKYAKLKCSTGLYLLGTRSDVPELYPDFDFIVHPSLSENLGGSVESGFAKTPTIATNIGGFPDVVIDKKTGLLVPKKSPQAIADAILYMLNNRDAATDMALAAHKLVKEICDVRNNASYLHEFYQRILDWK